MNTLDDNPLMVLRGQYATVRSLHENRKSDLSKLCGHLAAIASQVLRRMQPDNDSVPESADALLVAGRETIEAMEVCVTDIESLAMQRAELKPLAWGKK